MPRFHGNAEGSRGALGCQSDGENRLRRKTRGREAPAQARRGGLGLGVQGRGKEGEGGGRRGASTPVEGRRAGRLGVHRHALGLSPHTQGAENCPVLLRAAQPGGSHGGGTWGRRGQSRFCLNQRPTLVPSSERAGGPRCLFSVPLTGLLGPPLPLRPLEGRPLPVASWLEGACDGNSH